MKNLYLWLSGVFAASAVVNLVRVALKARIVVDVKLGHFIHYRVPLKYSLIIGVISLLLTVVLYLLSRSKAPQQ